MKLDAADFLGRWHIAREITDLRHGQSGLLDGTASFTATDDGLVYHEAGTLRLAGAAPMLAERRYLWTFTQDEVFVAHADGAPFHSFALTGAPEATPHLCGDDLYRGNYAFDAFPEWKVTWNVQGPRKDYRSVTVYTRA